MRTRFGAVLVSLVAAAALSAQQRPSEPRPQPPTFRGGTNFVRVDMYATRNGVAVEDLTRDDVEVLEDDVVQKIESFEHVKVRPAGAQELRAEPQTVSESRTMAADPRARVFVIFLDTYHTTFEGSVNVRRPLINFIDRVLGDDDLVAVMTPEMAASDIAFGRKTLVISSMLNQELWGKRDRVATNDEREDQYIACYGVEVARELTARRREKMTLDALEDLVTHLNGVRDERKAVLAVTDGWVLFRRNDRLTRAGVAPPTMVESPRRTPADQSRLSGSAQIQCEADLMALAALDHDERMREIGEVANRGNVTFYPVFARGLVTSDAPIATVQNPQQDAALLRTRQDSLRRLAVDTDGEAIINTNNIDGMLKRIADDLSSYYLVGYYSSNSKLDGRFRSIDVRVKQPGVRVRARRGYRGLTADALLTTTRAAPPDPAATTVANALNAVAGVSARTQLRVRAAAWPSAVAGANAPAAFWLTGEMDPRIRKELVWTAGATAEITVVAADGRNVLTSTLDVPAADGNFTLRVPESGGVPPGEYAVRVRLQPKGDSAASVSDTVRVIVAGDATPLGEPLLWRRGPSTGPRFIRTADLRFQRNERIRLELPAATAGTATTRLLDRTGKPLPIPLQLSEQPDASGAFRWIVVDVTLAPLATGDYAIEVTLEGAKQVIAFRVSS